MPNTLSSWGRSWAAENQPYICDDANISVVQDLSIPFPHKETAAVAGSSESRKRSIVKLLMRFYKPGQSQNLLNALKLKSST
jgi:ABC-type multidrug transport system fused ATPase/permease subunit